MANEIVKYEQQFEEIRSIITMHRERALREVNEESLQMSWTVVRIVSDKLKSNEWGSKVVTQLSEYLRTKDPTLKGYSRRNIYNMVMFYDEYSSEAFIERLRSLSLPDFVQTQTAQMNKNTIVQTASAQLPQILCLTTFSNHLEILNRCNTVEQRIFYILYAYRERLKNKELQRCIVNDTFGSLMGNKKNFSAGLKQMYPQSPSLIKDKTKNYWKVLKFRLKAEGNESVTNCNQLKMVSPNTQIKNKKTGRILIGNFKIHQNRSASRPIWL